ncbi:hypothetical protein PM082_009148 [Marasmius tenuissimus]|nr:hypothetical protein PM082_009148 [Marasmius tenuissimus]
MAPHRYANQGQQANEAVDASAEQATRGRRSARERGQGRGRGGSSGREGSHRIGSNQTSFAAARAAQIGVALPSLRTYSPAHIVLPHDQSLTTMARRNSKHQIPCLVMAFYHCLMHAEDQIPLFYSKCSMSKLNKHAGTMKELEHVQKKLEKMMQPDHPIISSSCRIVCPETEEYILTYIAERVWTGNKYHEPRPAKDL